MRLYACGLDQLAHLFDVAPELGRGVGGLALDELEVDGAVLLLELAQVLDLMLEQTPEYLRALMNC